MDLAASLRVVVANLEHSDPMRLETVCEAVGKMRSEPALSLEDIAQLILDAPPETDYRKRLHHRLAVWDAENSQVPWAASTPCNTSARRRRVYELLGLEPSSALMDVLDECLGYYSVLPPIRIGVDQFEPWWTETRKSSGFYGPRYLRHLEDDRGMSPPVVVDIDRETDQVVARLADPRRPELLKIRGIVLGHVQSGKTTNYAGVIAKSVDAGYRLVIVLTGMTKLLRNQTQRRLDMDLVGKELVESEGEDYKSDPEWQLKAISYGERPRQLAIEGAVNFVRLTRAATGYRELRAGISALEPQKVHRSRPLYDAENLAHADARIAVLKKDSSELKGLKKDLETLPGALLAEIPCLILDDECDLASINTKRPRPGATDERTKINNLLVDLLRLLPRAQYVGYTATPAASVLVELKDEDDVFPRSFFIALEPRPDYMGAASFHDLDWDPDAGLDRTPANSNMARHFRPIKTDVRAKKQPELAQALDLFVLTGAVKLFREARGGQGDFHHHTMLVHQSHEKREHRLVRDKLVRLWEGQSYRSPEACERLWGLLNTELKPTSDAMIGLLPESLHDLRTWLAVALDRIGADPVLVVNSDADSDTPDFTSGTPIWKILCGGTKLSRGYTIEGLTVTYFRRVSRAGDTLMQMGRWYGYRNGYRDLVRLFAGVAEPMPGSRSINLYEVFEALARDDRRLREDLRAYEWRPDDRYPVTPAEILPEIYQAHQDVTPTAKNKMFRAATAGNWGGRLIQSTLVPTDKADQKHNLEEWLPSLLGLGDFRSRHDLSATFDGPLQDGSTRAHTAAFGAHVGHRELLELLRTFRWKTERDFRGPLHFLGGGVGDPEIEHWAVLLPQVDDPDKQERVIDRELSVVERASTSTGRIGVLSTSGHVALAKLVAHAESCNPVLPGIATMSADLAALRAPKTGAMLVYLLRDSSPQPIHEGVQVGFALLCPPNGLPKRGRVWVAARD